MFGFGKSVEKLDKTFLQAMENGKAKLAAHDTRGALASFAKGIAIGEEMAKIDRQAANVRLAGAYLVQGRTQVASGASAEGASSLLEGVKCVLPITKPWLKDKLDPRWGDTFGMTFRVLATEYMNAEMAAGRGNRGVQVLHKLGIRIVDGTPKAWESFLAGEKLYLAWSATLKRSDESEEAAKVCEAARKALANFLEANADDTSLQPIHEWLAPLRKIGAF